MAVSTCSFWHSLACNDVCFLQGCWVQSNWPLLNASLTLFCCISRSQPVSCQPSSSALNEFRACVVCPSSSCPSLPIALSSPEGRCSQDACEATFFLKPLFLVDKSTGLKQLKKSRACLSGLVRALCFRDGHCLLFPIPCPWCACVSNRMNAFAGHAQVSVCL